MKAKLQHIPKDLPKAEKMLDLTLKAQKTFEELPKYIPEPDSRFEDSPILGPFKYEEIGTY